MAYKFSQATLAAMAAENPQIAKAEIYLASGEMIEGYGDDLAYNGLQFTGQILAGSDFTPGAVTAKRVTVILNNIGHKFDDITFDGAIMVPYIGTTPLKNESVEWRRMGLYYVTDPSDSDDESISLVAYDGIYNTAKTYDGGISFPATIGEIAAYCVEKSGLLFATPNFEFNDFVVTRTVDLGNATYQQILSYIASISGHFVECNEAGSVSFKWLVDTEKEITTKKIFSPYKANKDDVQITGCRVKASGTETDYGETVLVGEDGYVIELYDNPLVVENTARQVAEHLASRLNGLRFRPASLRIIPDISIDLGDGITFTGDQIPGKKIYSYVTHYSFTINEAASISCKAKSASVMVHQGFSTTAKTEAKQKEIVNAALAGYDNQAKNISALSANVLGFFYSKREDVTGKVVSFWHDSEQLSLSNVIYKHEDGIFYLSTDGGNSYEKGFDENGNPTLNILQAIGIDPKWIDADKLVARINNDAETLLNPSSIKATEDKTLGDFIALLLSALTLKENEIEIKNVKVNSRLTFANERYGFESSVYVNDENHLVFM